MKNTLDTDIYLAKSGLTHEDKMELISLNDRYNLPKEVVDFIHKISIINNDVSEIPKTMLEDLVSELDSKIDDMESTLFEISNIKNKIQKFTYDLP